jgi:hypothetical protein
MPPKILHLIVEPFVVYTDYIQLERRRSKRQHSCTQGFYRSSCCKQHRKTEFAK